ncbi:MAG: UDP-glucose/GDP-mannose dehydrogenase family protein [Candidatus Micrarchaeota archaeon]|nr:UDP-glucose/GDP-mannose dehydrogenase family protein [Candidatus Micrarchaeota archaeon]
MNISIVGVGYVGVVTGACFAEFGNKVICVDINKKKVELINSGKSPIYEPGLDALLKKHIGKNLSATTDINKAIQISDLIFICVGTPSLPDGSTDLKYIKSAAKDIATALKQKNTYSVIVVKSTVPPKTTESLISIIEQESGKSCGKDFGIAMNPEFLPEGRALEDFMNPDRTVIGSIDKKSYESVLSLYKSFKTPIIHVDLRTAEMIKYTSNAFLATKISFANEIGNICKPLGLDVYEIMNAVGMDKRIGRLFLNAGIGYGGSCFKKDLNSLIHTAKNNNIEPKILKSVNETNDCQPHKIVELAKKKLGSLEGKKITVLGLAFKPDSDDMREAPSILVINVLLSEGALVTAYDPIAMENAKKIFNNKINFSSTLEAALSVNKIIFILTEWKEFKKESLYYEKIVFDGRKVLNGKSRDNYEGVCW